MSAAHSAAGYHSRRVLAAKLLTVTRAVLWPLAYSILARTVFLLLGVGLFALAGWAVIAIPAGAAPERSIGGVIAALIAMSLLKGLARYLEQFAGHYVAFHSLATLRNYFYDRLEPQAPAATEGQDAGDLLNRVTKDIDRIEVFFAHTLAPIATAFVVPLISVACMGMMTSWWLALALTLFLAAAGIVIPSLGVNRTDVAARALRAERGRLATHVTDTVQGVREVLAFGIEERRLDEMTRIERRIGTSLATAASWVAIRRGLNQAVLGLCLVTIGALGIDLHARGELTLPHIGLALGIALGSFGPIIAVEDFMADLDQAFASAARVFAVTERDPLITDPVQPIDSDGRGDIDIDSVSFTYPVIALDSDGPINATRPEVLHDVSLNIRAGSVTAIVGASGSGKSTLASLLTRMWDPDSGSVSIGGVDVRDLSVEHLRSLVASAPQRPYVFNDSVKANLLLAKPSATDSELESALARVGLDEWVAREPEGMDTNVADMGERLSGGQRQRLALARALLRGAPITVLDEATSQVDADTERVVLNGIREATRGRTLIVVVHRISSVSDADQIIVMDCGRVVESGRYEDLLAQGGALTALVAREERVN